MLSYDESLTAQDVAPLLGIGRNTVYDLAKTGELHSYRLGRKLLFTRSDVQSFLDARRGIVSAGHSQRVCPASCHPAPRQAQPAQLQAQPAPLSDVHESLVPLLEDAPDFLLAATGPFANCVVSSLQECGLRAGLIPTSDYASLVSLYSGLADASLSALFDSKANRCNVPFVQRLVPGTPLVAIRVASMEYGLISAENNQNPPASWSALFRRDVRLVNRPRGHAERVLLDEKIVSFESTPDSIKGYDVEAETAFEAINLVSSGLADVCIASRFDVSSLGRSVRFKPLTSLDHDMVILKGTGLSAQVRAVKRVLSSNSFKAALSAKCPCDVSRCGSVVYEC